MSSTQFDGDIDSFVSYLKSNRGLSANTLKAYRADLTACLHLFELRGVTDLNEITLDDLRSWMAVESRDHARSSMARKTVAVRGFFAWAYEHGVTNTDPAATLMTPSIPSTLPAVLTESQAEQLLDVAEQAVATNQYKGDGGAAAASGSGSGKAVGKTADKSADTVNRNEAPARADKRDSARVVAESQRNAAILELLYATGIRVAELVSMDIVDVDFSNRTIKVTGKGNKQRVVPLGMNTRKFLFRYLSRRPGCASTDRVFLMSNLEPVTDATLRQMFRKLKKRSGIPRLRAHLLRHTFATRYLENGGDMYALQQILGHTSLEMVKKYVHSTTRKIVPKFPEFSPLDNLLHA